MLPRDGANASYRPRASANLPLARQNILFDPRVTSADQQIERLPPVPDGRAFAATSWSPDGHFIAGNPTGSAGIFVYDVSRREFRELTPRGISPVWTPDGRHMVFRDVGQYGTTISIIDYQTRAIRQVFSTERETVAGLDVSPNGREIAAVIMNRQADIVLAKLAMR